MHPAPFSRLLLQYCAAMLIVPAVAIPLRLSAVPIAVALIAGHPPVLLAQSTDPEGEPESEPESEPSPGPGPGPGPGPTSDPGPGPAAGPSPESEPGEAAESSATGAPSGSEAEGGGGLESGLFNASGWGLSNSRTSAVSDGIGAAVNDCATLAAEYRIDCLGKALTLIAARLVPVGPDYREMRHELRRTGNRLRRIARQNRDLTKPKIRRPQRAGRTVRTRSYRPIKQEVLQQATEDALKVIAEAQTRLLRSGESSERRRVHYRAVSRSLGTTTRILRS